MENHKTCWGLLSRRPCLLPTLRGWLVLALSLGGVAFFAVRTAYPFLAVTRSLPGGVLVVEGWSPDRVLKMAVAEYKQKHYDRIYVTGLPVETGTLLTAYTNYAHVGAAMLIKLGMDPKEVQAVPCGETRRDRTYHTALSLKHFFRDHNLSPRQINLLTVGPHARRSWLLFEKAFGETAQVGIIAAPAIDYDARSWWRCSAGFRNVTGEIIAYGYARLLFHPRDE